jgi:hypothetical protein
VSRKRGYERLNAGDEMDLTASFRGLQFIYLARSSKRKTNIDLIWGLDPHSTGSGWIAETGFSAAGWD